MSQVPKSRGTMQKNLLILALMATAVVTLGFVSVAHHNRSELLVGSTTVVRAKRAQASMKKGLVGSTQVVDPNNDPRKRSAPPISIGNQAASQAGSGFFTQAKRGRTAQVAAPKKGLVGSTTVVRAKRAQVSMKKGLVGSTTVRPGQGFTTPGIGNQAAPHGHMNPGTNIVFHNVMNEGGVVRARK